MKAIVLTLLLATPSLGNESMFAASTDDNKTQLPLNQSDEWDNWIVVNDTVMGGRSSSQLAFYPQGLLFFGDLSLKNNGGFASVRRVKNSVQWQDEQPIWLNVQGDGRVYQFRLRTNKAYNGIAYSAKFKTQVGKITTHKFMPSDFTAQWRGRRIVDAAPLEFSDVTQMGFLLGDKNEGPFELLIKSVNQ